MRPSSVRIPCWLLPVTVTDDMTTDERNKCRSPAILGDRRIPQFQFTVVGFDTGFAVRNTRRRHVGSAVAQCQAGF